MSAAKAAFAVIAEFTVKQEQIAAFLNLARDDAFSSLRDEPGCRQFDVLQSAEDSRCVVFYEVYDSRDAFENHLKTPHLERFKNRFPALVERELPVRFLVLPEQPSDAN